MTMLTSQLDAFGQLVRSNAWETEQDWSARSANVAKMAATSVQLLDQVERAIDSAQPASGWDESVVRHFLPLLRQWIADADQIREAWRQCKAHGYPVEGTSDLLRAMARTRPIATNFDEVLEISRKTDRGDTAGYRTLEEIMNELSAPPESETGKGPS